MPSRIQTFLQGLVMGATEVIPGVSSSTLALVMGIYEKYVEFLFEISEAVKQTLLCVFGQQPRQTLKVIWGNVSWRFGLTLAAGMIVAVLGLAKLLGWLLEVSENGVFAFFFGLVLGALIIPFRRIKKRSAGIVTLAAVTTFVFFLLFHFADPITVEPPLWLFFIGGFIGVSAMVLPGISGSFVLLVMGVYKPTIQLVSTLLDGNISGEAFLQLGVLGAGVIAGFLLFIRFVRFALQKWHDVLMAFLGGLMVASLRFLWPFASLEEGTRVPQAPWDMVGSQLVLYITLILLGVLGVLVLQTGREKL